MVRDKKINSGLAFDFALKGALGEGAKIFGKLQFIVYPVEDKSAFRSASC
ncbi:MAG: hypothetical protein MR000_10880 [Cloacibacillus porcorum]|nr:hypothetical protein [Cloacibacillus porcorum]